MAKPKSLKATDTTAVEREAINSVPPMARQHAAYGVQRFTDRPDGESMQDNARAVRIAPIKPLEGLASKHPKASQPFLSMQQLAAAFYYDTLLERAQAKYNHELGEIVDSSPNIEGRILSHMEANDTLARLHIRMPIDYKCMCDNLWRLWRDNTMREIWPNRALRNINREIIGDTFDWLATEFGYQSNGS